MTLSGRHVLVILVVFFGVVIVVNCLMMTYAIRTFSGLDEPKSYAQGLNFGKELEQRAAQKRLGWRADVNARRGAGEEVMISLTVRDAALKPVTGLSFVAELEYPATSERDLPLAFNEAGPGAYRAVAKRVSRGQWTLVVRAAGDAPHAPFELTKSLWLP